MPIISNVFCQTTTFPNPDIIISDDMNLKSITIKNITTKKDIPFAKLGDKITVAFDDLDADRKHYFYTLEHYDANWEKTNVLKNNYITGFEDNEIFDFEYSFGTLKKYTHYSFTFPNDNFSISKSGNYLLKVYLDSHEEPAFVRRLVFYENMVSITSKIARARDVNNRKTKQQIDFAINHNGFDIKNPSIQIRVCILQNNVWNNAVYNLQHQYISNNMLIYKYSDKTNFEGGNYFYHFDTKRVRVAGLFTDYIILKDVYNTFLYTNTSRKFSPFSIQQDYNGGFVIRSVDYDNSDTHADYTKVHFFLDKKNIPDNSSIFVYGAFNDWRIEEDNSMIYIPEKDVFASEILLKQGYYDYKYVSVNNSDNKLNENSISGSFYQTENKYTFIVYYKGINSRMDRVIGVFYDEMKLF